MRRLVIYITVALAVMMSIMSCNYIKGIIRRNNAQIISDPTPKIAVIPDSVKEKIAAQDSVMKMLVGKIDTITTEVNITKDNVSKISKKVKKIKVPSPIWQVLCFILSVIAIFLAIKARKNGIDKKKAKELFEDCLKERKKLLFDDFLDKINHQSQSQPKPCNANNRKPTSSDTSNLYIRISEIEKKLAALQTVRQESTVARKTYGKTGYVRSLRNGLFTVIDLSNKEGSMFKITFINEGKGIFSLINLNTMKTINGIEDFVETEGSCTLNEANSFKEISSGECIKEDKLWKVTKRLKINISK